MRESALFEIERELVDAEVYIVHMSCEGAVDAVRAKIAVHVCFGNLYGRPFQPVRSYRNVYPAIHALTASQAVLEYAKRGMDDLAGW